MLGVIGILLQCLMRDIVYIFAPKIVIHPWMLSKETIIIEEILKKKKPKMCLEWGSGGSTLHFSRYLENGVSFISIEHNKQWFDRIRQRVIENNKIKLYHAPPKKSPWIDDHHLGSLSDFRDYVEFPKKFNQKFDFILVDGRARKACMILAINLLKTDGVVILHDANREYYWESFRFFNHTLLFKDFRHDAGGIWIGSKALDLQKVLDINKHKLNWIILEKLQSKFARIAKRLKNSSRKYPQYEYLEQKS